MTLTDHRWFKADLENKIKGWRKKGIVILKDITKKAIYFKNKTLRTRYNKN